MNPIYRKTIFRSPEPLPSPTESFGIVTACNPHGQTTSEKANRRANARFVTELAARNLRFFPVTGGSPDFAHAEPGYGIFCDRETAIALAIQFDQEAIFWVEAGTLFLISCREKHPEQLGPLALRWEQVYLLT